MRKLHHRDEPRPPETLRGRFPFPGTLTATNPATAGCAFLGADMANPNPSPDTRFKPGQIANPTGKTAEQAARDLKTADLASQFRAKVLSRVMERAESGEDALELLTPDVIRVLKDSEDRAHGTPKQSVEHGGEGGGPLIIQWRDAGS